MQKNLVLGSAMLVGGFILGWFLHAPPPAPTAPAAAASSLASASASAAPTTSTAAPTPPPPASSVTTKEAFEAIYKDAAWGKNKEGVGHSGTGSTMESTRVWRTFLQQFMKFNDIHSVVDAGCGDWEFSHAIDWTGIDYKGFDIVASVIEQDKKKYEKPNIHFFAANVVEYDLPKADLLISKHVLQHLPHAMVKEFLEKQVPKYKHVLIMSGINAFTFTAPNLDISPGQYRELDLTAPPFKAKGFKILNYWDGDAMHQVVHMSPEGISPKLLR